MTLEGTFSCVFCLVWTLVIGVKRNGTEPSEGLFSFEFDCEDSLWEITWRVGFVRQCRERCPWEEIHRKQNYPCSNGKGKCPLWCAPQHDRHGKLESHWVNSGTAKGCEHCFSIPRLSFCVMSSQVTAWTQWYQRRGRTHGESPGTFKVFWTAAET